MFKSIIKRDGRRVAFDPEKITIAISKAGKATGEFDYETARRLTIKVLLLAEELIRDRDPHVEEIQDIVEEILLSSPYRKTAKAYIIYRDQHARMREIARQGGLELIDSYLSKVDWRVRENSNMSFSLQGLNNYISSEISKSYWLHKIYPPEVRKAHIDGSLHIHDLNVLAPYCVGWDLMDLLIRGFGGVAGKVESKPAKHFRSALGQIVNFLFTLQGEAAGAQAFSNIDTLLAPFIAYDELNYKQVKQALQEWVFNLNVPTRVGFQCLSQDTEILTPEGWKKYNEVEIGDLIYTFNLDTSEIETKPVTYVFRAEYSGYMYCLKNRSQQQLISPGHRVVRKIFNTKKNTLEPIEDILKLNSPVVIPVTGENKNPDYPISDEEIKLLAWIMSEGSIENNGSHRVSLYQSPYCHFENYNEIIELLEKLGFEYTVKEQKSLGLCAHIRLSPSSSKKVHTLMGAKIKKFPEYLYRLSKPQARLFLETYIKGDGWYEKFRKRITVTDKNSVDFITAMAVLAGYNFNVKERKAGGISRKIQYIITLTETKNDHISKIEKIDYTGVIWSVHTENETVIARRNGQVFITGNTPFSNITLDLKVPEHLASQAVIIGGKTQEATYGEFQKEMDMFNRALFEVLTEGDAKGRVFTFPIPTINITKDFDWQSPVVDLIMQATAKYGIPYFANYVNSDLKPEDARSMCLAPEEEIIFKNSGKIKHTCIKELAESYKVEDFDDEGWAECNSERNLQVLSLNPQTFKLEWTNVKRFLKIKTDKALEITTEDGKKTIFSPKHPVAVYTSDGLKMKFAKDLSKEDFLLTLKTAEEVLQREYQKIEDMVLDEDLAKILGYFTAEGNYLFESKKGYTHYGEPKGMQFTFRGDDFENIDLIRTLIEKLFKRTPKEKKDSRYNVLYLYVYDSKIARIFYQAGFRKYGRLPQIIFNSPVSVINEFLEFFIKGDGYIKRKEIHLNDLELSRDLALLLTLTGKPITYRIRKNSQRIYLQHAKSGQKKKNGLLNNPILSERLPGWLTLSTTKVPGLNKKRTVGLNTLDKYSAHTEESLKIKNSHIYLTRIKEIKLIEYEKPREFYDLELEKNHLFVHSLGNISFNCCRLRLETRELKHRGGGLFGSNPLTGSTGVVTLNLPRIGYLSSTEEEFFAYLTKLMDIAKTSLEIKRKVLERFTEAGLYPYSKHYLSSVKERTGAYWSNHFSTIGIIGMNEAIVNARWLSSKGIWTEEGKAFALKVMDFMREKLMEYQTETGNLYNLEATPAEGTSYRLAKIDKQKYPDIFTQGKDHPYYTNSTWLPVNFTESITYILDHQDELQSKYTGGTVIHLFLGEQPEPERLKNFIKAVFERYRLPYISITPTFSVCLTCGYIEGQHSSCPKCGRTTEVYSRVVGYLRPVDNWNDGKKEEFKDRKYLQILA